jgi:hypothetical protein
MIMVSEGYGLDGKQKRKTMTWRPDPGMTKRQIKKAEHTSGAVRTQGAHRVRCWMGM